MIPSKTLCVLRKYVRDDVTASRIPKNGLPASRSGPALACSTCARPSRTAACWTRIFEAYVPALRRAKFGFLAGSGYGAVVPAIFSSSAKAR